jgi:hypothetical protein
MLLLARNDGRDVSRIEPAPPHGMRESTPIEIVGCRIGNLRSNVRRRE